MICFFMYTYTYIYLLNAPINLQSRKLYWIKSSLWEVIALRNLNGPFYWSKSWFVGNCLNVVYGFVWKESEIYILFIQYNTAKYYNSINFPVWLRNRLSAGLESVLSHTEKNMYRIVLYSVFYEYENVQS